MWRFAKIVWLVHRLVRKLHPLTRTNTFAHKGGAQEMHKENSAHGRRLLAHKQFAQAEGAQGHTPGRTRGHTRGAQGRDRQGRALRMHKVMFPSWHALCSCRVPGVLLESWAPPCADGSPRPLCKAWAWAKGFLQTAICISD